MPKLDDLAHDFLEARVARAQALAAYDRAQADLVTAMDRAGKTRHELTDDHGAVTFSLVRSSHTTVDEDGLESELSVHAWRQITRRRVDRELLDAATTLGKIPAELLVKCVTSKPRKPWVKVTRPN